MLPHPAREDKKEVAQAIDIFQRPFTDFLHPREPQDLALGSPTYRAALMEIASDSSPTWKHKGLERSQLLLALIDDLLDLSNFPFPYAIHTCIGKIRRGCQLAAQIKQLILDLTQDLVQEAVRFPFLEPLLVEEPRQSHD